MAIHESSANLESTTETWNEIEDLVEEIAQLSKSELSTGEFYAELLGRAVRALAAVGGCVWIRRTDGRLTPEYQIKLPATLLGEHEMSRRRHERLLETVMQSASAKIAAPQSGPLDDSQPGNPTDFLLLLCPFRDAQGSAGVIEVLQRPGASPATQQGYLDCLQALCELATDFHRNHELRALQERAAIWDRSEEFAARVHGSLDLGATAYVIANEGRALIDCDRLGVAVTRGSKCKLLAVSGVDVLEGRSNFVRQLERLIAAVVAAGEPLWFFASSSNLPPQIEAPLEAYLGESHARVLAIIPLKVPAAEPRTDQQSRTQQLRTIGALVAERYDDCPERETFEQQISAVRRQSESALRNAMEHQSLPLLGVMQAVRKLGALTQPKQMPKTVTALLILLLVVLAMLLVPANFVIEGRGELQPLLRRDVFAVSDGVINEIRAKHSQHVGAGDVLVVLRKSELEYESSRVLGEIQTANKRLATVKANRLKMNQSGQDAIDRSNQLTAEEEELKELLKGLGRQHAILKAQHAELTVRSPIDGQILTWDVNRLLESRPVQRGQRLMTIADLDGPWVLEMRIPDDRMGHVLAARREIAPDLDVSFILKSNPETTHRGRIKSVAENTHVDENDLATVFVTVEFDRSQIPRLRPGATVRPRIHCGRKPIGYVWLHDLWDAVRTWFLFH